MMRLSERPLLLWDELPVDSVAEVRTIVGNTDVTYGRSSGAQVDLVTKSGSNQWHGSANEFNRESALAANDFFNNLAGVPRAQLTRNQFGASLGGPIMKNKLFFFFNYDGRRDAIGVGNTLTVPLTAFRNGGISYINNGPNCTPSSTLRSQPSCISTLTAAQVAALDPQGVGADQPLVAFIDNRYPEPNGFSEGDGVNTGSFLFTAPYYVKENTFTGRIDYKLSATHTLFARGTWDRDSDTQTARVFPQDPNPLGSFIGHERSWVVADTWIVSPTITNQVSFGLTRQVDDFPINFAPTAPNIFQFGVLSNPYGNISSQGRNIPVPEIRDTFSWSKGKHTMQSGADIKPIRSISTQVNDINVYTIGLSPLISNLNASLRPSDICCGLVNGVPDPNDPSVINLWDTTFTTLLGTYAGARARFNYDVAGNPFAQFTPLVRDFHYNEYEFFAQDTWNIRSDLTVTYGLRWIYHSVPFEAGGFESVPTLFEQQLFDARSRAAAAGINGDGAAPFVSYQLGGPVNNGPGYYTPDWKDFSPRLGIAYSPSFTKGFLGHLFGDRKTSIRAGGGVVYDRILNTLTFEVDEFDHLFDSVLRHPFGVPDDPTASLLAEPRFTSFDTPPPTPPPGVIPRPTVTPFVSNGVGLGLYNNQVLFQLNNNMKTPYAITASFGIQKELSGNLLLEVNYFGRFGRRLIGTGDPAQQLNFRDAASGQFLNTAFGNVQKQRQANTPTASITAQPWFENQINLALAGTGLTCSAVGAQFQLPVPVNNCTQLAAELFPNNFVIGDLSTVDLNLANGGLLLPNTGLFSQAGSVANVGNFGSSSYNALIVSLRKRLSSNLQFDFDYAFAHSIDNVSDITNDVVLFGSTGQGLICDLRDLRLCRGNSDFDATHTISANYEYQLPIGRGQRLLHDSPKWVNTLLGGWETSGIVSYHTGFPWNTVTNAFAINFTQNSPAVYVGPASAVRQQIHVANGALQFFADPVAADNAFAYPFGGGIGQRNALRGPSFSNVDMAILKNFKMPWSMTQQLQFRLEAFNAFNHPSFDNPSTNFTNNNVNSPGQYGIITDTVNGPRQIQLAFRYNF